MNKSINSIIESFRFTANSYDIGTIAIVNSPNYERFTCINRCCYESGSMHAEVQAIKTYYSVNQIKWKQQHGKYIKKYELIVFRINRNKNILNARPCRDCAELIYNCGIISKIHFINEHGALQTVTPHELLLICTPLLLQRIIDYKNGGNERKSNKKYTIISPRFRYICINKIIKHDLDIHISKVALK
jgi:hypothetical protein